MINKQYSIVDDAAKNGLPENYSVSIEITEHALAIVLFDKVAQKFTAFESWLSEEKASVQLFETIANSEILKTRFDDVHICLLTSGAVLVPMEFFIAEEAETYLDYTITTNGKGKVFFDEIPVQQAFCCHRIPESLTNAINNIIPNPEYSHFSTSFISEITQKINSEQKTIVVFFHENAFEIACLHQKKLIHYNSFSFQTVQEYLYFILLFLQQSNLDTEKVNCIVTGGIEEKSALMQATLKYIRNVEHRIFTDDSVFREAFEPIPKNRYDMLFQIGLK